MDNTLEKNTVPENDKLRIEALKRYKILGSPPENAFDNVARLATQIFNVPIALISLVDNENVYFKTATTIKDNKSNSGRSGLCSMAVHNDDETIFGDMALDPCFLVNPMVTSEFGFKFYASAPLTTYDGFRLGTICIIGKEARLFPKQEEELLKGLAKIVMDEIELRLSAIEETEKQQTANALLVKSEAKARFLISDAPIAIGVFNSRELIIESANDKILEVWGKTEEILGKPLHIALPELHGQPFLKILDDVFTSGEPFYGNELKVVLNRSNGPEDVYFNFVYHALKDNTGATTSIMVVATEVTELVLSRKNRNHT